MLNIVIVVITVQVADIISQKILRCTIVVRNLSFILHIHDFVFVCPPNTQSLSLIENERKSSILICSLLCPGAFPEIQCEFGMATGFHKIYACLYLVLDSFHTIAHGILKTTSIDKTALFSLSS